MLIVQLGSHNKLTRRDQSTIKLQFNCLTVTDQEMEKGYKEFLENKKHLIGNFGFDPNFTPDIAFDFQEYIIRKAVQKGRMAIFADTGLGKTLIQLSIAQNIVNQTNKKVLILTPLAVGFQFMKEAEKIGIDDIEQTINGSHS